MRLSTVLVICILLVSSCSNPAPVPSSSNAPLPSVDGEAMKPHIQTLSADQMEGRAPGGKGEEMATAYISGFFSSLGLKTQFQAVPMVGVTSTVSSLKVTGKGGAR